VGELRSDVTSNYRTSKFNSPEKVFKRDAKIFSAKINQKSEFGTDKQSNLLMKN
jgi:hypothetical protein